MTGPKHHQTPPVSASSAKPTYWTGARLVKAASALWGRVAALRADIAGELRKHDDERFGLLASNVADSAELSIADVVGDIYLAEIDRDVRELRDVESALERISNGTYGSCVDCAEAVDPVRLELNPHAARCLRCQEKSEQRAAKATVTL